MRKFTLFAVCIAMVFVLIGCASTKAPIKEANETIVAQNTRELGKNGVPQPDWVGTETLVGEKYYASASARFSKQQNSIKAARTQAKALLAEYISSLINEFTKYYSNEAGVGNNTEAVTGFENAIKDRAEAMLTGTIQEDMWEATDGTIWILMSMPLDNVEQNLKRALEEAAKASNTYVENESATKAKEMMATAMAELSAK